jgi:branched-chain amino acid transport system substrate-binding protein
MIEVGEAFLGGRKGSHMRRGLMVLLCALLATPSCAVGSDNALDGEIPIGATLELTGSDSVVGAAHRNSLRLVAEEVNARGVLGKRIKLIIKDNRSNPVTSGERVKKLIEDDKVVAVIGGGTSATTLSAVSIVEEAKVPLVSMGSSDEIVSPVAERRHVFKTPANPGPVVAAMLREFEFTGVKTVGILAVNDRYGDSGVNAVRGAVAQRNMSVVGVERFAEDAKDHSAQASKLVAAKPNVIVVWAEMPGAGIAARSIKDAGFPDRGGKVYFEPGAGAELFVKGAGAASENMMVVHPTILAANQITATTPSALAQKEFFTKYTQKYATFSGYASYSADALRLVVAAIEKARSTDRAKVRDALESLRYDGLTGSYTFSPNNHGGVSAESLSILIRQNGGWALVQ